MNQHNINFLGYRFICDPLEPVLLKPDGKNSGLQRKALAVLMCLLERPNQIVTRKELRSYAWEDDFGSRYTLDQQIGAIRRALGDSKECKIIETIRGTGYRLVLKQDEHPEFQYQGIVPVSMVGQDIEKTTPNTGPLLACAPPIEPPKSVRQIPEESSMVAGTADPVTTQTDLNTDNRHSIEKRDGWADVIEDARKLDKKEGLTFLTGQASFVHQSPESMGMVDHPKYPTAKPIVTAGKVSEDVRDANAGTVAETSPSGVQAAPGFSNTVGSSPALESERVPLIDGAAPQPTTEEDQVGPNVTNKQAKRQKVFDLNPRVSTPRERGGWLIIYFAIVIGWLLGLPEGVLPISLRTLSGLTASVLFGGLVVHGTFGQLTSRRAQTIALYAAAGALFMMLAPPVSKEAPAAIRFLPEVAPQLGFMLIQISGLFLVFSPFAHGRTRYNLVTSVDPESIIPRKENWRTPTGIRLVERLKESLILAEDGLLKFTSMRSWLDLESTVAQKKRSLYDSKWLSAEMVRVDAIVESYKIRIREQKDHIDKILSGNFHDEILQIEVDLDKIKRTRHDCQSRAKSVWPAMRKKTMNEIRHLDISVIELEADLKELKELRRTQEMGR